MFLFGRNEGGTLLGRGGGLKKRRRRGKKREKERICERVSILYVCMCRSKGSSSDSKGVFCFFLPPCKRKNKTKEKNNNIIAV